MLFLGVLYSFHGTARQNVLCRGFLPLQKLGVTTISAIFIFMGASNTRKKSYNEASARCRNIVMRHYPDMSVSEIASMYGYTEARVARWARVLHLKHSPETQQRLKQKRIANLRLVHTSEYKERILLNYQRIRRSEIFRIKSGMPRKTKLNISLVPPHVRRAISNLVYKYNYFRDISVGGQYTMYYDEDTRRTPAEALYVERYKLKFEPAYAAT